MVNLNIEEILKDNLSFYNLLSNEEQKKLIYKSNLMSYKKCQLVSNKNSTCTGILVVSQGQFRTYISAPSGREITLFTLLERDVCMLSASCAFNNLTYNINIEADMDSTAIVIDSLYFSELSKNNINVLNF
ncbi:MAG: cyclic nucleotide-binding domain-containing protein, partial [Peptostreptococcaceae bacterium]